MRSGNPGFGLHAILFQEGMAGWLPYLDGGCSDSIPYRWAIRQGYKKVIVVRTRMAAFRKPVGLSRNRWIPPVVYHVHLNFAHALKKGNENYNIQCGELEELQKKGKIFVISPSKDLSIARLEPNMEKLGALYYLGYSDAKMQLDASRNCINKQ